jgi:hypothetical protein
MTGINGACTALGLSPVADCVAAENTRPCLPVPLSVPFGTSGTKRDRREQLQEGSAAVLSSPLARLASARAPAPRIGALSLREISLSL